MFVSSCGRVCVHSISKLSVRRNVRLNCVSDSGRFTTREINRLSRGTCSSSIEFHCRISRTTSRCRTSIIVSMRCRSKSRRLTANITPCDRICRTSASSIFNALSRVCSIIYVTKAYGRLRESLPSRITGKIIALCTSCRSRNQTSTTSSRSSSSLKYIIGSIRILSLESTRSAITVRYSNSSTGNTETRSILMSMRCGRKCSRFAANITPRNSICRTSRSCIFYTLGGVSSVVDIAESDRGLRQCLPSLVATKKIILLTSCRSRYKTCTTSSRSSGSFEYIISSIRISKLSVRGNARLNRVANRYRFTATEVDRLSSRASGSRVQLNSRIRRTTSRCRTSIIMSMRCRSKSRRFTTNITPCNRSSTRRIISVCNSAFDFIFKTHRHNYIPP